MTRSLILTPWMPGLLSTIVLSEVSSCKLVRTILLQNNSSLNGINDRLVVNETFVKEVGGHQQLKAKLRKIDEVVSWVLMIAVFALLIHVVFSTVTAAKKRRGKLHFRLSAGDCPDW